MERVFEVHKNVGKVGYQYKECYCIEEKITGKKR